ncbi:MAG: peptidylprolyl isomerase [bacterium]|nr:peptidylprolyl isomerase [bacterium]
MRERACAALVCAAALAGGCAAPPAAVTGGAEGEVLARVGDRVITDRMLEARVRTMPPRAALRFATPQGRRQLLDSMIEVQLVSIEAERQGLGEDPEVLAQIEEVRRRLLGERMRRRVFEGVTVSPEEVEAEYEAQGGRHTTPAQVRVRQILFSWDEDAPPDRIEEVEREAAAVLERARRGEDFAALAERHSLHAESAAKGGDIGVATRANLPAEAYAAAMRLERKGEVSDLVRGETEIRILMAEEVVPERRKSLEEMRQWLERLVLNRKQREAWLGHIGELKERYDVEVYEDRIGGRPARREER